MPRPPKEFHRFASLVDQLLEVPKDAIVRLVEKERAKAAKNPNRPGPKPKKKRRAVKPAVLSRAARGAKKKSAKKR